MTCGRNYPFDQCGAAVVADGFSNLASVREAPDGSHVVVVAPDGTTSELPIGEPAA